MATHRASRPVRSDPAMRTPHPPASVDESALLRKPVNTLAIVPKSTRITVLGRKAYNVLLYHAQDQGLEKDVFRAPLSEVITGLDYDSNDQELIKKHLRAMVSTTVEWQSPTTGEGTAWHVSGLLAHAKLAKERGQVWVEWSYAVNLKQELLQPTVFARLRLEIISQLRSHAGVALYEICTRYKEIGRTARQPWRWWYPVLTGNPAASMSSRLEYRFFKRDTLTPAIAEVNAITDIDVELVEHKQGRSIDELQFRISPKKQSSLQLNHPPVPVDMALVAKAQRLGIGNEAAESLCAEYGQAALAAGLDALERRQANAYPEPVHDPLRYLRALMPGAAGKVQRQLEAQQLEAAERADPEGPVQREQRSKRHARWLAEWTRRQNEKCALAIEALSLDQQQELERGLIESLEAGNAHPSIIKRLRTSGWQHPLVRHEMLRYFGDATFGAGWDKPTAEQLLEIAVEMGEGAESR